MPSTIDSASSSTSSSRKSLIERLASLRIQSSSTSPSQTSSKPSKGTESPRYIPRSAQSAITTKSKFYQESSELLASPTIGRRRKLNGIPSSTATTTATVANTSNATDSSTAQPFDSPKYFPKQKFVEIGEVNPLEFPTESSEIGRNHTVKDVVTSFIDSFAILNNFLTKSSNSTSAKLHLQNMNTSFAALQMDLKVAVSQLNDTANHKNDIKNREAEIDNYKKLIESQKSEILDLKSEILNLKNAKNIKNGNYEKKNQELEEQLRIALNQIAEIKLAFEKEKENVEFLQNYMEEIIQLKDEGEQRIAQLEKQQGNSDLVQENKTLKETVKLLEMERLKSKNVCEQALQVLDTAASTENIEELKQELKLKQVEIEKLKGREKHFKESNEIFQQKLVLLTEENRKLRGQRPLNHY